MIGQRCVQQQIKATIERNDLANFIILVGDTGSGRKTLAKEVAKWVDAECIMIDKGVDAIREAVSQAYKLSEKVIFVLDGDNMSQAAKSALLKVTEEPPNQVKFILTVTDISQIFDTLISRARVYRMDAYTKNEIAWFAGSEDWRYPNFCTNKYEVDLLNSYGMDEFVSFVNLVVENISTVDSANALKIEDKISLTADDGKYDMKIFLQAFRTECVSRWQESKDFQVKVMYEEWEKITTDIIAKLRVSSLNKQSLMDMWIFNIRGVEYADS